MVSQDAVYNNRVDFGVRGCPTARDRLDMRAMAPVPVGIQILRPDTRRYLISEHLKFGARYHAI
jgi:hypothetical protein